MLVSFRRSLSSRTVSEAWSAVSLIPFSRYARVAEGVSKPSCMPPVCLHLRVELANFEERGKYTRLHEETFKHTLSVSVEYWTASVYNCSGLTFLSLLSLFRNSRFWEELIAYFPCCDMNHIQYDESNNSYIAACVFVGTVTFLLGHCLAMIEGYTYRHRLMGGIYKVRR
jgi:hypothetical protein